VIVPDVNLLLYAHITAFRKHERARAWWEELVGSGVEVGLAQPVLFGFVRIGTLARAFNPPLSVDSALATVESWLACPSVHLLTPGPRHIDIAFDILRALGTAGNLTTDVQIAAHAIENRGEVHSNDSDFGRIPGVRWTNPLK